VDLIPAPSTLRDTRIAKGIDLRDMASRVGVGPRTYDDWERGLAMPNNDYLTAIADVLGVDAGELLGLA